MSNSNRNSLQNKVALVLGGSRGIGAAIVERLAAEGAAVAFTFVSSAQKAEALAAGLRAQDSQVLAIQADSADEQALRATWARVAASSPSAAPTPSACRLPGAACTP